jgi:hypothetical protein
VLILRAAQLDVLEAATLGRWLRKHLLRFFPARCRELGDRFDAEILAGMAKARGYGFREPGDISRFLDIAFGLGADFDTDPDLAWARGYLVPQEPDGPSARMDALVAAVEEHASAAGAGQGAR